MNKLVSIGLCFVVLFINTLLCVAQRYYHIEKVPFSVTEYDDFAPAFFDQGLLFVSNRPIPSFSSAQTDDYQNTFHLFLYDSNDRKTSLLSKKLTSLRHEGPVSYCTATRTLFFTRTQKSLRLLGRKNQEGTLGIMMSTYQHGVWSDPEPFIWNSEEHHTAHPAVSEDGQLLFFSSDREGSLGRMDLFYVKKTGGTWSDPIHLGEQVNTLRNEGYPYYQSSTGKLYFSSNGIQPRVGNLDIYYCYFDGEQCDEVHLLPKPINTIRDDFGYISVNDKVGYFTSNRDKELTHDQIYAFSLEIDPGIFENCLSIEEERLCIEVFEEISESEEALYNYIWEMGDGAVKNGHRVSYCYQDTGAYHIQLHVVDKLTGIQETNVAQYRIVLEKEQDMQIHVKEDDLQSTALLQISARGTFFKNKTIEGYYWMIDQKVRSTEKEFSHIFDDKKKHTIHLSVKTEDKETKQEQYYCKSKTINRE